MKRKKINFADDDLKSIFDLFKIRFPSLIVGLFLGMTLSFATSSFEEVISKNVEVAFFIPFIVYLADALGTQTQNIYARDLKTGKASFKNYFVKELALGILFGLTFALAVGIFSIMWLDSFQLSLAVALSTFAAMTVSPVIALIVTEVLQLESQDPAVGAGPIATIIQDTSTVMIYGYIATAILG